MHSQRSKSPYAMEQMRKQTRHKLPKSQKIMDPDNVTLATTTSTSRPLSISHTPVRYIKPTTKKTPPQHVAKEPRARLPTLGVAETHPKTASTTIMLSSTSSDSSVPNMPAHRIKVKTSSATPKVPTKRSLRAKAKGERKKTQESRSKLATAASKSGTLAAGSTTASLSAASGSTVSAQSSQAVGVPSTASSRVARSSTSKLSTRKLKAAKSVTLKVAAKQTKSNVNLAPAKSRSSVTKVKSTAVKSNLSIQSAPVQPAALTHSKMTLKKKSSTKSATKVAAKAKVPLRMKKKRVLKKAVSASAPPAATAVANAVATSVATSVATGATTNSPTVQPTEQLPGKQGDRKKGGLEKKPVVVKKSTKRLKAPQDSGKDKKDPVDLEVESSDSYTHEDSPSSSSSNTLIAADSNSEAPPARSANKSAPHLDFEATHQCAPVTSAVAPKTKPRGKLQLSSIVEKHFDTHTTSRVSVDKVSRAAVPKSPLAADFLKKVAATSSAAAAPNTELVSLPRLRGPTRRSPPYSSPPRWRV